MGRAVCWLLLQSLLGMSPRFRGLFPLPAEPILSDKKFDDHVCRKVRRRRLRRLHRSTWLNDGLVALNDCAGYRTPLADNVKRSAVVTSVLDGLSEAYHRLPDPPPQRSLSILTGPLVSSSVLVLFTTLLEPTFFHALNLCCLCLLSVRLLFH